MDTTNGIQDNNSVFSNFISKINNLNVEDKNQIIEIVNNINIDENNLNEWIYGIFSDKIEELNMGKLPYIIDELYKTNDQLKFMICCMLLESTCDSLKFITDLENYPLFVAKYQAFLHTLVTIYERVDNFISMTMALIMLNNDPEFKYLHDLEMKKQIIEATKRKLDKIYAYLKRGNINPEVYDDLGVIVDLACYLHDAEISKKIEEIDKLGNNESADIFIIKYQIINNIELSQDKINMIKADDKRLLLLYEIIEDLDVNKVYLSDITQEKLATLNMLRWLRRPNELDGKPDKIELLGEIIYNDMRFYAFKFSKEGFSISGDLFGISGGFPKDLVSARTSGYTFSKFEHVEDDWKKQANDLIDFVSNAYKNR